MKKFDKLHSNLHDEIFQFYFASGKKTFIYIKKILRSIFNTKILVFYGKFLAILAFHTDSMEKFF